MIGRFFVWVGKSIAKLVGLGFSKLFPKKEKTEKAEKAPKEKRPRRIPGKNQDTPNPPEA